MAPPAVPEGFTTLADLDRLGAELKGAGLSALEIKEIEVVWEEPAGQSYLDDVRELHGYMGAYATLDDNEHRRVDEAVVTVVDRIAKDNRVVLRSTAVLAVGTRQ